MILNWNIKLQILNCKASSNKSASNALLMIKPYHQSCYLLFNEGALS